MMRRRGPGLVGTMARTAVIAGTATAVSGAVVNRQQRKANEQQAAVNRVKFGRSKSETRESQAEADRRRKELDDKKLD